MFMPPNFEWYLPSSIRREHSGMSFEVAGFDRWGRQYIGPAEYKWDLGNYWYALDGRKFFKRRIWPTYFRALQPPKAPIQRGRDE